MSCQDFETNIYIYSELSQKERDQLDVHLQTCLSCTALFSEVKHVQQMVNQVANEKIIPRHAARLTGDIMSGIIQTARPTLLERISAPLLSRESKYALSFLSSVLLLVFCLQSFDDSSQLKINTNESLTNTVILNAKLFRENFSHNKEKRALFADCRSPFQSSQYYMNCAKSKLK